MDAVYVDHGREVVPTEHARGPWDPNSQHRSAPAALLARAVEREIGDLDGQVVRLSVELMRPAPLAALTVKARTVRAGKKLRLVEAVLSVGDVDVAQATAVWLRTTHLDLPASTSETLRPPPPGPEAGQSPPPGATVSTGFFRGSDTPVVARCCQLLCPACAESHTRRT